MNASELTPSDVTINGLGLTAGQLRNLLYRAFWKQTLNADLNTVPGCEQAATIAADLLCELDWRWNVSSTEMAPFKPSAAVPESSDDGA